MKRITIPTAIIIIVILAVFTIVTGCKRPKDPALKCSQTGTASWYGTDMKGQKTASGEKYDPNALTAASKKFPLGTELEVTNLNNDRNVTVTVNDRGPYSGNRVIDMSEAAANELGMKKSGLAPVCVQDTEQTGAKPDPGKQ